MFGSSHSSSRVSHKQLNLALQGGGAHGAFTAGVLGCLLDDGFISVDTISGTSAGAVNAVAFAAGYQENGTDGARAKLRAVWQMVGEIGDRFQGGTVSTHMMTQAFLGNVSPYTFNPFNYDPLREVLETHIDFTALATDSPVSLYIAATKASTGAARIFTGADMTIEAVLASCCLPFLSKAVIIDGEAYWDGAFSANPALRPVVERSNTDDTLIIQLSDSVQDPVPTSIAGMRSHLNRLSFHQSLRSELAMIHEAAKVARVGLSLNSTARRLARHRFHLIDGSLVTGNLAMGSELAPTGALIDTLYEAGQKAADVFLESHRAQIGVESSIDLNDHFDL